MQTPRARPWRKHLSLMDSTRRGNYDSGEQRELGTAGLLDAMGATLEA